MASNSEVKLDGTDMVDAMRFVNTGIARTCTFVEISRQIWVLVVAVIFAAAFGTAVRAEFLLKADGIWTQSDDWKIYGNNEYGGCFAEQLQIDGTHVLIGIFGQDDRLAIGFSNDRLSFAKARESYVLKLAFDGRPSRNALVTSFETGKRIFLFGTFSGTAKLIAEIAHSGTIAFHMENKVLATVSLKGIPSALEAMKTCHQTKYKQAESTAILDQEGGSNGSYQADNVSTETVAELLASEDKVAARVIAQFLTEKGPAYTTAIAKLLAEADADKGNTEPIAKLLNEANRLFLLGLAHAETGKFNNAEQFYRVALGLSLKATWSESPDVANALINLANVLLRKGDLVGADPLYRRALAIKEQEFGPEHPEVALALHNLAGLLLTRGDLAGAEPLYRRALAIKETELGPEHPDVALSLHNLAGLLLTKNDIGGAESLYLRARAINEKALWPSHRDVGTSLSGLAEVHLKKGDLSGAEPLYRRALEISEKALGPEHAQVGTDLRGLASLLKAKSNFVAAEELYRRALAIHEKVLGPNHADVGYSLNELAFLVKQNGDSASGLNLARRAAQSGHPRRSAYLSALFGVGIKSAAITLESFEAVQNTATSEAGSALNNLAVRELAGDLSEQVRIEQDLTAEKLSLEKAILVEVSKEPAKRKKTSEDAIRERTTVVSAELLKVREKISIAFPEYAELSRPSALSLNEAQELLADDEALVVIDVANKGQGDDYVWAVTRTTADWKRLDTRQGDIADSLARLRASLDLANHNREPIDPAMAHNLYEKLLGPVKSTLSGRAHLIFVLNGSVSSLPPQVLVSKPPRDKSLTNAHWLVRDHAITVLPTVSSLKLLRSKTGFAKAEKPFIGYGDPVFNPETEGELRVAARGYRAFFRGGSTDIAALKAGLSRLPGTGKELRSVAKSLGVNASVVNLREAASEAAVKKARLVDYNIVYFATHGLVAGEVDSIAKAGAEPALALTIPDKATDIDDGLITASEVASLKLNADWVVLSACNTAAEGKPGAPALSGLARAFFYAGARSLLVSHWVVDDDATAELMSRTFANAAANPGRRQAEALRQAMLSVMDDPKNPQWADPGYWAAFVLVGEAR